MQLKLIRLLSHLSTVSTEPKPESPRAGVEVPQIAILHFA